MGAVKLKSKPQARAKLSLMQGPYKSAAGITLFEVNSRRAKNMPDALDDIIIAKMIEIDPKGFGLAYSMKDALYLTGLAGRALTALQVREKTNRNDGYMVEMIQKVGGGQKGWAWCMYEQQTCVGIAETLTGIVSLFPYSGSCAEVRNQAKKIKGIIVDFSDSTFGDVWIKVYSNGTGHTGNFDSWITKGATAYLNEGNTTAGSEKPGGPVVREGGGSYRTARDIKKDNWVMNVRPFPKLVSDIKQDPPAPLPTPVVVESNIPKYGEISDRVLTFQRALNRHGASLKEDGKFFELTKAACARFQKANGMKGTGIPGSQTMALLLGAVSVPEIAGDPKSPNWGALMKICVLDSDRVEEIRKAVNRIRRNESTYRKIAEILDCKWEYVGLVHYRESSALTLDVYLHNGQKLGKTTTIVPKGVFFRADQFIEAAVDAMKNFRGVKDDGMALAMFEKFNGLGYRSKIGDHGVVEYSPYITAATNHSDETGKYVSDGKYSPTAHEAQLGVMALLKGMAA